jgi:type VI secretion system protein ImpA
MSAPLLDLPRLLAPVPGPSPAGSPIRDDDAYIRLIETRRTENADLPQGIWKRDVKRADWRAVIDQASDILANRSKDLQVAVWLLEAETRRHGFAGLAGGFVLIDGLCQEFWPTLYPELDPGDAEVRNAPFDWLNEKLPILLQQIPVTRSGSLDETSYTWTDYINGQRHEVARQHDPKSAARAEDAGRVTLAEFAASAAETPAPVLVEIYRDLGSARTAAERLQNRLDDLAGRSAPSLIGLIRQIETIGSWARALLIERHALPLASMEPEAGEQGEETPVDQVEDGNGNAMPDATAALGPIASREDAYRQLAVAADYLFRTEPHSPVPYLIHRAIAWGQMPLHELLPEMMRGKGDFSLFMELMGIHESS